MMKHLAYMLFCESEHHGASPFRSTRQHTLSALYAIARPPVCPSVCHTGRSVNKKPRYRKDDTQYMSALKIVCKRKVSRLLHKNRHITILSLFGGEIIFEVFQPM